MLLLLLQCGRRPDRSVHHAEHRAGAHALRGRRRHVPDGQDAENAAARDGSDRGTRRRS